MITHPFKYLYFTILSGQTGVNGTSLNATCGGGCEGSTADTIGLYEWDTVTETVVGQHNLAKGYGGANPFSSSSGGT